tara:strand:+ start:7922 stop:9070 length:1149 start_codon:yes stop_codon:yes gene_type:complete
MTYHPTAQTKHQADNRSVGDGDDVIEFAEFTGDDDAWEGSSESATEISAVPSEAVPPAWFRSKSETSTGTDSTENPTPAIATSQPTLSAQSSSRQRIRKKRGGNKIRQSVGALIETSDETPEPLDWKKDWKKLALVWLVSNATAGYGVSLIFHTVLLGGLSAIVYHSMDDNQSISMIITDADAMPIEFTEIMDLTVEPAGGADRQLPQLQKIPITASEAEISSSLLDSTASNAGNDGDGGSTDEGFGFAFSMPEGGKVVSKGSFSAWTVPEDPEPGKDYMIVIRIRLPESTKLYRITDLSGKVEGSDTYIQHLPFDPELRKYSARSERNGQVVELRSSSRLRVINNHVQVMIPVMGGDNLVRDTIYVRSRMLNEDQKLEIEF